MNETLWKIEDKIRQKEKEKKFDEEFIELARSVYITNDERAKIKKEVNEITNSHFKEEIIGKMFMGVDFILLQ